MHTSPRKDGRLRLSSDTIPKITVRVATDLSMPDIIIVLISRVEVGKYAIHRV
jgi:hypothetical protein